MIEPPLHGHSDPRILNRALLPHPFGPSIIVCIPGWTSKLMDLISTSPAGEIMGTSLNTIELLSVIVPLFDKSTYDIDGNSVVSPFSLVWIYVLLKFPFLKSPRTSSIS